jgi:hypothetical protein
MSLPSNLSFHFLVHWLINCVWLVDLNSYSILLGTINWVFWPTLSLISHLPGTTISLVKMTALFIQVSSLRCGIFWLYILKIHLEKTRIRWVYLHIWFYMYLLLFTVLYLELRKLHYKTILFKESFIFALGKRLIYGNVGMWKVGVSKTSWSSQIILVITYYLGSQGRFWSYYLNEKWEYKITGGNRILLN